MLGRHLWSNSLSASNSNAHCCSETKEDRRRKAGQGHMGMCLCAPAFPPCFLGVAEPVAAGRML